MLEMVGGVIEKDPIVASCPLSLITIEPEVAFSGIRTVMELSLQFVAGQIFPLTVTTVAP